MFPWLSPPAPQTYEDGKGRRILIGWLGNSKSEYPSDKNGWAHMLTIPRELTICAISFFKNLLSNEYENHPFCFLQHGVVFLIRMFLRNRCAVISHTLPLQPK
ncbi:hypothetical protein LG336_07800 [Mesobacillus maritimus]